MEETSVTYDWDNLICGNPNLNHSEHFFDMRRNAVLQIPNDKENFAHVINRNQTMSTKDLFEIVEKSKKSAQEQQEDGKVDQKVLLENAEKSKKSVQEQEDEKVDQIEADLKNLLQLISQNKGSTAVAPPQPTTVRNPSKSKQNSKPSSKSMKPSTSASVAAPAKHNRHESNSSTSSVASNPPAKQSKPSSSDSVKPPNPPNAYNYVAIYKAKNSRAEQQRLEREREARIFRPRPLPDFKRSHRLLDNRLIDLQKNPTCPQTPPTLKRSIESAIRRQILKEENLRASKPPDFKARPADVLCSRPYKPQLDHREIVSEPFNLQSVHRSENRKAFKDAYEKAQELKAKQEKEEAEIKDRQIRQTIRKQTVFRARPNPFSSSD